MTDKYDGINTLSRVASAAYSRKTAQALVEANRINQERNRLMRTEAMKADENAKKAREDARRAISQQTRIIQAEQARQSELAELEHKKAELARKKEDEYRQNEIHKSNMKSILFSIYDDMKKTLADSNCSPLDKYIHICGAITILKEDNIDQSITDNFSEKEKIQKMIDDINDNHKSVRDSFTKQDETDHDELLKILETDEERKISSIEKEIDELKKMRTGPIESLQKKLDGQDIKIKTINKEINEQNQSIERLQKKLIKLNDDSYFASLQHDLIKINNDTFLKDLISCQKTGSMTPLVADVIYSKIASDNEDITNSNKKKISVNQEKADVKSDISKKYLNISAFTKLVKTIFWPIRTLVKILAKITYTFRTDPASPGRINTKGEYVKNSNFGKSEWEIENDHEITWWVIIILLLIYFIYSEFF